MTPEKITAFYSGELETKEEQQVSSVSVSEYSPRTVQPRNKNRYLEVLLKDKKICRRDCKNRLDEVGSNRFQPLSFTEQLTYGLGRKSFGQTVGVATASFLALKEVLPNEKKYYAPLTSLAVVFGTAYLTGKVAYEEHLDKQEAFYRSQLETMDKQILNIIDNMN